MAGAIFDCSEVVAVAKKSENNKFRKKKRKGYKVNEEEGKIPLDGIYATAGIMTRSVNFSSQCD